MDRQILWEDLDVFVAEPVIFVFVYSQIVGKGVTELDVDWKGELFLVKVINGRVHFGHWETYLRLISVLFHLRSVFEAQNFKGKLGKLDWLF